MCQRKLFSEIQFFKEDIYIWKVPTSCKIYFPAFVILLSESSTKTFISNFLPSHFFIKIIFRFRLSSFLVDHFPIEVLCHLLRPLLSPAYRCTTAFGGAPSPPDVVSLEHALALSPAPRRGFLATLAQTFIDKLSEKMTAAGKAADFAKVFWGDEKCLFGFCFLLVSTRCFGGKF